MSFLSLGFFFTEIVTNVFEKKNIVVTHKKNTVPIFFKYFVFLIIFFVLHADHNSHKQNPKELTPLGTVFFFYDLRRIYFFKHAVHNSVN